MQYGVRSEDGVLYRVGLWVDGEYHPGSRDDALREARGLAEPCPEDGSTEPHAYVLGTERRSRHPESVS